jgi:hypothetical protein
MHSSTVTRGARRTLWTAALGLALSLLALAPAGARTTPATPTPKAPAPAAAPKTADLAPATGEARQQAEALFTSYIDLEHAFNPALIDLYASSAHIESRLIVAGRAPQVRTWKGKEYKDMLRRALAKAKETKQDLNYYSAISYLREGSRVRIKAMRYAEMQKAVSPVELLVGPDADGHWRIFEELSESHPAAPPAPAPKH